MQFKKFIISLGDDGTQESELNRFLRGHRVLKVDQHFLDDDKIWTFLVCYLDGEQKNTSSPVSRSEHTKFEPEKELDKEQYARYQKYADIRLQLARKYAVKAFVIFTNRELGELSKVGTLSVEELRKIDGLGESRINQYGLEFLSLLAANETSGESDAIDCSV